MVTQDLRDFFRVLVKHTDVIAVTIFRPLQRYGFDDVPQPLNDPHGSIDVGCLPKLGNGHRRSGHSIETPMLPWVGSFKFALLSFLYSTQNTLSGTQNIKARSFARK